MEKTVLRTPLSYYGGKQQLARIIPGMIPEHTVYRGPFRGGAAVFFAQEPSKAEIINDTGGEIISFYEVPQRDFPALKREIEISPRSRKQRRQAWIISGNPDMFGRVKRAWAVRMPAGASYACRLDGAFGYDRTGTTSTKMANKRADFKTNYAIRLQRAQIGCRVPCGLSGAGTRRGRSSALTRPMRGLIRGIMTAIAGWTLTRFPRCRRHSEGSFR